MLLPFLFDKVELVIVSSIFTALVVLKSLRGMSTWKFYLVVKLFLVGIFMSKNNRDCKVLNWLSTASSQSGGQQKRQRLIVHRDAWLNRFFYGHLKEFENGKCV